MIKDFIKDLWDLNRLLLGKDATNVRCYLGDIYPEMRWSSYKSGQRVMTWRVPEEWVVHEAYIEDEQGNRYLDYKDNPLHLVAYSTAIDKWMEWDELYSHLYFGGNSVPWKFKYYERDWGFCCPSTFVDKLNNGRWHVIIKSEFKQGIMLVGELQLGNIGVSDLVIASHYDHPYQANDGLSGVAVALEVYERLRRNPPDWFGGVRFLFVPETIGSIAYLTDHDWDSITGGIFLDACGNDNDITEQFSFPYGGAAIDDIVLDVLHSKVGKDNYNAAHFRENFCNDEIVFNSPPFNIPFVGLSRYPYPEYHTSADTINIIHEDKLVEMADVVEEGVRQYCTDYVPIHTYSGVPFLSGYNLWVDWADNPTLNKNIEKIFMRFNGKYSISEIANDIGMDYWAVREYAEKFRKVGLIKTYPVGRIDD